MAFFQLFSSGIAKSEEFNYTIVPNSGVLVLVNDNEDNQIYQIHDTKTNEFIPISIFDKRNIISHQYGASQLVFKTHYHRLINDSLIWDEIQNIFPWQEFETKEYAKLFYKFYLGTISECGCGYAAATNYVFRMFEGREEEFYNVFGYPMYKVTTQYIDFNYEIFMLKFFNYYIKSTNNLDNIKNYVMKKVYEYKLEEYTNKKKEHKKSFNDFKNMNYDEYKEWKKIMIYT